MQYARDRIADASVFSFVDQDGTAHRTALLDCWGHPFERAQSGSRTRVAPPSPRLSGALVVQRQR
ncbi:hypothetical protein AB0M46_46285 [Dactylosporangium sp. NPDC051485]|uniref:hypothetical protein n=1 Tax=Dactylosporangium sp. NPDC051485 TaxID=3154846 RepID=UPI0034408D8E